MKLLLIMGCVVLVEMYPSAIEKEASTRNRTASIPSLAYFNHGSRIAARIGIGLLG
jgi:hypothetical protein